MSIESKLKDGIIYTKVSGELNYETTCKQIEFIASLRDEINNHFEISDLSGVTKISLTTDDMAKISSIINQAGGIFPHSVVCYYVTDDFQYGMARMFETYMDIAELPMKIQIFKEKEKAIDYLNCQIEKYGY